MLSWMEKLSHASEIRDLNISHLNTERFYLLTIQHIAGYVNLSLLYYPIWN